MKQERRTRTIAGLVMAVVSFLWLVPLLWGFLTTFKSEPEIRTLGDFKLLPQQWVLDNYTEVFMKSDSTPLAQWFLNSMIISTSVALLTLVVVSLTAYGYSRMSFPGRDKLFFALMGISLFPNIINIIPMYRIMSIFDWVNTSWAVIVPSLGGVANIFLVRQFLMGIPREFDEAARIDGAGEFLIFGRIILPMLRPVLTVVALFSFTGSWNDFLWPTIVFNDVNKMTLTAGLQLFNGAYGGFQIGLVLAAACLAMLPTFILYLFAQKYFMQSLSLSAGVKG